MAFMFLHQYSVTIHCSVQDAFGLVTDRDKLDIWRFDLHEHKILTPGPFVVGSRWQEFIRALGTKMTVEVEVMGIIPDQEYAIQAVANKVVFRSRYQFEAIPEGTRLTITVEGDLPGIVRFLEPMIKRQTAATAEADLNRLKSLLDAPR